MLKRTSRNLEKVIQEWRKKPSSLLVLTGRRKTGKDVLVEYVMRKYPIFKHYRIAEAPNLIAQTLELPLDRKIQQALFGVNKILYPILGELAFKRRVAKILDREKPKFAIVEAVRLKEEYDEFVVKRGGILIGITADDKIRHARGRKDAKTSLEKRDEKEMTFGEFMDREKVTIERDIDWIVKHADFIIENSYTDKRKYYEAVDKIFKLLGF